jgi:hypothetical protein
MGDDQGKSSRAAPLEIARLIEPLAALQRLLDQIDRPGVIIGGIAASLIGKPRVTADLDAVVIMSIDDLGELVDAARQQGLIPRIADEIAFARKNRVLLLEHEDSGVGVDISLGILPFESEMIERSEIVKFGGLAVRLPMPEDLIILKAIAQRPKDLEDIRAIAASHPDLDRERIRFWVEQFAEVLEQPDLWARVLSLL